MTVWGGDYVERERDSFPLHYTATKCLDPPQFWRAREVTASQCLMNLLMRPTVCALRFGLTAHRNLCSKWASHSIDADK